PGADGAAPGGRVLFALTPFPIVQTCRVGKAPVRHAGAAQWLVRLCPPAASSRVVRVTGGNGARDAPRADRAVPASFAPPPSAPSKPVAGLPRLHIGGGIGRQQQALGHKRLSRSLHLRHIVGARPIALLDREARIARGLTLGLGLAEGDVGAV